MQEFREEMKTAKTNYAKKILAAGFLLCSFLIFASAQKATLTLKNGKATVKKMFSRGNYPTRIFIRSNYAEVRRLRLKLIQTRFI